MLEKRTSVETPLKVRLRLERLDTRDILDDLGNVALTRVSRMEVRLGKLMDPEELEGTR